MQRHSFATIVSSADGALHAAHLPLTVHEGEGVCLRGHFAKGNPQWRMLEGGETLAIFTGPHAYVSPEHYDKFESVLTWNYLAVHAYSEARLLEPALVTASVADLVAQHEPAYQNQWDNLSERYKEGMMRGIVAFELRVTRLEGAAKLSQNKTAVEQQRIAKALCGNDDPDAAATGAEMQRRLDGSV